MSTDPRTDDLHIDTLDLDDTGEPARARVKGWTEAMLRSFHEQSPSDDYFEKWLAVQRAEKAVLRGVWERADLPLAGPVPVATFGFFDKHLNTGAAMLVVRMITDVTVSPTHRRRGIMRRLMTEHLDEAARDGRPVAVLTASEGAIYQRFGFGVATTEQAVRIDTSAKFRLRAPVADGGRVVLVDPASGWEAMRTAYERFHEVTRGSLERPSYYETWLRGYDWEAQSDDRAQRIAVRLDADGEPDGFVVWAVKEVDDSYEVRVRDLIGVTPQARIALWQFVADIDLADVAVATTPNLAPLPLALVDQRVLTVRQRPDHVWVRVLDVVAALEARPWFADDVLVVRVHDPLGHADGAFTVGVADGRATVTPATPDTPVADDADERADVELDVETLGSLYLGGVRVPALVDAGRVAGSPEALERFAAMTDGGPEPRCATHF
ncbi:GNAT family N-acetyltransferase [Knoellia sp. LjRoot47]|uniref:GNAT family N-acetyltransferase n=1 Tax=Knoellia sp. LjRoot47 TaxID=3342330 RepID=UPI003ED0235C